MSRRNSLAIMALTLSLIGLTSQSYAAERAGTFKVVNGSVSIERNGATQNAEVGDAVLEGDTVITAESSFAGITLRDNTRLTSGPGSTLVIDDFAFDTTTHKGRLSANLKRGKLAVISGKLAKSNPESVQFNTGSMTVGVRGTEFILEAAGE
ncbi:FecR family protein [Neptuniibacter halophilus]|uniref:FecR family protein n=1 Tax=Neptuniibacter halophilus TaxID=651666 RepID=UPI0025722B4A|nr:FecR domain-containing protein [Neptuniibacter halophilus]